MYHILILRTAQKELAKLPHDSYEHVKNAVFSLSKNPRPHGCIKLKAREGFRIRVGNYRIIYEIDEINHTVTVLHIGHRKDIYR